MSTRLDFADHREQPFLISIRADNVDLDLRGHTLDRGWNRKPNGGRGIEIVEPAGKRIGDAGAKNITIRNGTLRGFGAAIAGLLHCRSTDCERAAITYDTSSDTYHYAPDNINVVGIRFEDVLYKLRFSSPDGRVIDIKGDRR